MNLKNCIQFALDHPICFLATIEGDQPHVRPMKMERADETGYAFATLNYKDMSRQLHLNPKVEICFFNNATELLEWKSMRICGTIEFIDTSKATESTTEIREKVTRIAGKSLDPYVEIFKITSGDIHFWSVKDIKNGKEIKHIKF